MIEQLNSHNLQKLSAELATGFNRLQALMQIGETRIAQVVSVVAQPARSTAPQRSEGRATRPPNANAATTDSSRAGVTEQRSATSPQSQAAATAYRIRIQLQGQMLDLVSPKPLPPGTQVQLTRTGAQQIQLQPQPAPQGQPSTASQPSSQAGAQPSATGQPPTQQAPTAGRPAAQSAANSTTTANPASQPRSAPQSAQQQLSQLLPQPNQSLRAQVVQSTPLQTPSSATPNPASPRAAPSPSTAQPAPGQPSPPAQATVDPKQLPHRVLLNIGGRTLEVQTPRALPVGSEVRISRNAEGMVEVRLPAPRAAAVDSALRQHLPRQQPPDVLLNQLAQAVTPTMRQNQPLLAGLIALLLGRSLSNPSQADPEGVKQQLQNGGSQLENRLARGDSQPLPQDHKALLLKLAQQLQQPASKELPGNQADRLSQATQQAVSRVISNQIRSLGLAAAGADADMDTEPPRSLVVDLPVNNPRGQFENVELRISQQPGGAGHDGDNQRWQVELAFAIDQLPPLRATLSLEQQQVSVIWYGDSGVRGLLAPHLDDLQQRLELLGLNIGVIGVREAPLSGAAPSRRDHALIDVKT